MPARRTSVALALLLAAIVVPHVVGDPPKAKEIPVAATCVDEEGKPISSVTATLYKHDRKTGKVEKVATKETGKDGRFELPAIPAAANEDVKFVAVLTKPGRGSLIQQLFAGLLENKWTPTLMPAATLSGRVTNEAGQPVVGAKVWCGSVVSGQPFHGVRSAVTDKDGRYAITDMPRFNDDDAKPRPDGKGRGFVVSSIVFDVSHPDFAADRPTYRRVPSTVDVELQVGGVVQGRVVDRDTGKPSAGAAVRMQGKSSFHSTKTDDNGLYQIRNLKAGTYNLWADLPDRACAAIDSLNLVKGQSLTLKDLTPEQGGFIEGVVVDAMTGKPVKGPLPRPIEIGCYGPARPKSGAACQSVKVDNDGTFKLRLPPGTNYPYDMTGQSHRTDDKKDYATGIEVKSGETTKVEFKFTGKGQ